MGKSRHCQWVVLVALVSLIVVVNPGLWGNVRAESARAPRGYMTSLPELARIKAQADQKVEPYAAAVAATIAFADKYLPAQRVFTVPDDYVFNHKDLELPDWMCEMNKAAYGLALAFRLTGNEAYAKKAREYLLTVQKCKNLNVTYQRWAMVNVSVHVPKFVHAADLLEGWEGWSMADKRGFQDWACQAAYPISRRSLKENVGGNHAWAESACMTIADYCWDRPDLRFKSENPADKEVFDAADAYAHARQEFFNQVNGNNGAAVSYNTDNFAYGQETILAKSMIRPDGGVPDGLLFSEKADATLIKNLTNGGNYTLTWLMSTLEAYMFGCELAYRRGDPGLFANIRTTPEQQYVSETDALVTLPSGRGSVREMFIFLLTNEDKGGPALNFNDYHRGVFEIYLRRYKDWALPAWVDWRLENGQFVGGRLENRALPKQIVDRITAFLQTARPIADAWIPFVTLTHADPLGVVGEPPIVPPPGGEVGTPAAPKWVTAKPHNGFVSLAWQAPPGATGYQVKRSTQNGTGYEVVASGLSSSKYTDTGLKNDTTYYYVVVPLHGSTEGKAAAETAVTPQAEPPRQMIVITLIQAGSSWKYSADGKDPGPGWKEKTFADGNWPSGTAPYGFGAATAATKLTPGASTYYFRRVLTVSTTLSVFKQHLFTVSYTGGFAVYLNGQEILRRGLPEGPLTYNTPALGNPAAVTESIDLSPYISKLPRGAYTLAVEVHQKEPGNGSFVWDAKLTSVRPDPLVQYPE